nr:pentatricopeptide repeat-containing protein, mitochondrial [Quercus suber]POE94767.1 pentatricopeptide repeat-containing protein, mitochondrial [Quercus suber]
MLERAKACLQSGARETLRSKSKASRSRRTLHCDFWTSGASSLDLSPWLPSSMGCATGNHVLHPNYSIGQEQGESSSIESSCYGTPFLDFLYPPQALSLLHRNGGVGRQWERWEKRNARRLPEGFIHASRGYASRSGGKDLHANQQTRAKNTAASLKPRGKDGSDETNSPEEQNSLQWQDNESPSSGANDKRVKKNTVEAIARLQNLEVPRDESSSREIVQNDGNVQPTSGRNNLTHAYQHERRFVADNSAPAEKSPEQEATDIDAIANTPRLTSDNSDLVNETSHDEHDNESPYARLQRLQRVMASARIMPYQDGSLDQHRYARLVDRVLEMYHDLPRVLQDGVPLKHALIEWLEPFRSSVAEDKCVSLYSSLARQEIPSSAYTAIMTIFMRRHSFRALDTLYDEVLHWLENSQQITKKYFQFAVLQQRWDLASSIVRKHRIHAKHQYTSVEEAVLWVNLSHVPTLLAKAINLMRFLEHARKSHDRDSDLESFCAKFCKEALIQELNAKGSAGLPSSFTAASLRQKYDQKELQKVVSQIQYLSEQDTGDIYENLLLALSQDNARFEFRSMYWLASYLYYIIQQQGRYQISEQTMGLLLSQLTSHLLTSNKQGGAVTSLSISQLAKDWVRDRGQLQWSALKRIMNFFALAGQADEVDFWMKYAQSTYSTPKVMSELLWTTVRVHAQKADIVAARQAFSNAEGEAASHSRILDIRCWNSLLFAYARVDDIDACLQVLQHMIDQGIETDAVSFLTVLVVLGKRGDVGAIRNLMSQYEDITKERAPTQFFASLISAHVKRREISEAENLLHSVFENVSSGHVHGPMTWPCNTILMAHAARRDIDSTMRVYEWMKSHQIQPDERTLAALMQALAHHSQTHAAWKLLRVVMPEQKLKPSAMHYAIIMRGYVQQGMVEEALMVHDHMTTQNIKSTNATNAVYLQAKAFYEDNLTSAPQEIRSRGNLRKRLQQRSLPSERPQSSSDAALSESIEDLKKILRKLDGTESTTFLPGIESSVDTSLATLFGNLIYVHGKRGCFSAVHELYAQFQKQRKDTTLASKDPILIVYAMMDALLSAGDYDEVEKYWRLAKQRIDEVAPPMNVAVPDLVKRKRLRQDVGPQGELKSTQATSAIHNPDIDSPATPADVAAIGFNPSALMSATPAERFSAAVDARFQSETVPSSVTHVASSNSTVTVTSQDNARPRPAIGKAHLLSGPLRLYLGALASQNRILDIVNTVSEVLNQGYQLDIRTWNTFIEKLCLASPPLTLLAYVLTERYLIPQFPGWTSTHPQSRPRYAARTQGLQYIRARFLPPGLLMPQYSTLVYLGTALLRLRHMENTAELASKELHALRRYVGTLKQVRSLAPRTLYAVQSMPAVRTDPLQAKMLRREE